MTAIYDLCVVGQFVWLWG